MTSDLTSLVYLIGLTAFLDIPVFASIGAATNFSPSADYPVPLYVNEDGQDDKKDAPEPALSFKS